MSISSVRIANFALSKIGERSNIESLDENSSEAEACNLWFVFAREQALSAFNWSFARKRIVLASASQAAPETWVYRYVYPADCLKIRWLENPLGLSADPVPFDIELNDSNVRTILTNLDQAKAVYTANVMDPGLFPPFFIDYFATVLARYIAFQLTGKTAIVEKVDSDARTLLTIASAMDANEKQEIPAPDADWIRYREGYSIDDYKRRY